MKYIINILLIALLASCSSYSKEDRWAKEPHSIKYSKEREKEVWGHVLRDNDPALYFGTPVQIIAEAIVSGENSVIKDELEKLATENINYQEAKFHISLSEFAITHDNFEALQLLIENGANPNLPSDNGDTPFTESVIATRLLQDNRYLKFLIKHGGDVNYKSSLTTVLMMASNYKLENVKLLIESGADPHYIWRNKDSSIVQSPLKTAIMHDKIDIVNYYLIECNVDPNSITVTNPNTGKWTIIDKVNNLHFKKSDTVSYRKKMELLNYLRDRGFKLRGE